MKFRPIKAILSFIIVLVITGLSVHFLSVATRIDDMTSEPVSISAEADEAQEAAKLTAVINEKSEFNFFALLAFVLIVFGTVFGVLLYFRMKAKNPDRVIVEGRKYNPKKENMFKNPYAERQRRRAVNARRRAVRSE